MFLMVPPLLDGPVRRMCVIGNAAGTIARAYGELYPDVEIDGIEIDPEGHRGRAAVHGPRRQPSAPRRHGRRTPLPPGDGRALRRDRRRRIPPALYPVLPRNAASSSPGPGAPCTRRRSRSERRRRCPATIVSPRRLEARFWPSSPRLGLEATALQRADARLRSAGWTPGGPRPRPARSTRGSPRWCRSSSGSSVPCAPR